MARIENGIQFGGSEDFGPYMGPSGDPYHSDMNHVSRSVAHQPNHWGFLKKLLRTKPENATDACWINRHRLMKHIRNG